MILLVLIISLLSSTYCCGIGDNKTCVIDETLKEIIYDGLVVYEATGIQTPLFQWAIGQLQIPINFLQTSIIQPIKNTGVCIICAAAFKYLVIRTRLGADRTRLLKTLIFLCATLNIQTENVCRGIIELNIDIFLYIINEKTSLNEREICSIILQNFGCFKSSRPQWSIYIPHGVSFPRFIQEATNNGKLSILHITDIHIDTLYEEGSNAVCKEPLCCQKGENASKPENGAGKWGDYRNCDMPWYSFVNMLDNIVEQSKQLTPAISYVYFTGDIIGHRVWETSRSGNTQVIKDVYKLLKDKFHPIPVYSIMGNHEPHPLNVFAPTRIRNESLSTQWVYDLMVEVWTPWLPEESFKTIHNGGYYTVVVRPGFRIIGLNSNVCYVYNWWLLYENRDPFYQLHWLAVVLEEAERKNESVHILSHVPPGDDTCLQEWTRQFRKIVQRFSHTITGQFNGHTHYDELRVFYNKSNSSHAINVAYNGGSFTTFNNLNPNYRIYEVDSETFEVLDFHQWMYDVVAANSHPDRPPNWFKLYTFKDAYGLNTLKPQDVGSLVSQMRRNHSLLERYHKLKVRHAAPALLEGCRGNCLKENYCSIVTTEVDDTTHCDMFL